MQTVELLHYTVLHDSFMRGKLITALVSWNQSLSFSCLISFLNTAHKVANIRLHTQHVVFTGSVDPAVWSNSSQKQCIIEST